MKTKAKPSIVQRIERSKQLSVTNKIIKLFAVVMTNYRQQLGDEAWSAMRRVAGDDQVTALSFLTGVCMGAAEPFPSDRMERFCSKHLKDWK